MNSHHLARVRHKRRNRRTADRDRRMLDGTLKYRGQFLEVELHNLSESGAFAVAPITPRLADLVTINIDLPELGRTVMITGRVRRVGLSSRALSLPGGFGIEFTRFYSQDGQKTLHEHLVF
jgi:hypothetical protein